MNQSEVQNPVMSVKSDEPIDRLIADVEKVSILLWTGFVNN